MTIAYNGFSGKERLAKFEAMKLRIASGELAPATGPCAICGDSDIATSFEYHDEDYSVPYVWTPPAMYSVCGHCHGKLHRRFEVKGQSWTLWPAYLAHVRRGGHGRDWKTPEVDSEIKRYRGALAAGTTLPTLSTLNGGFRNGVFEDAWFSKLKAAEPHTTSLPAASDSKEIAAAAASMDGDRLYQERARRALPVLVRQALAGAPMVYQQLAEELGMANPRNLNYVLGSVGQSLIELGRKWQQAIPPIQCLVVNKAQALPGQGFGWFMPDAEAWRTLSKREKAVLVQAVMQQIYAYPRWLEVLAALNLALIKTDYTDVLDRASAVGGAGESEDHRRLKEFVRLRPELVEVSRRASPGLMEKCVPSGDRLDVYFETNDETIAVEVKSGKSNDADLVRGLFQCVKYTAVLNALAVSLQSGKRARSVLVLEGKLPPELVKLKLMLGVDVVEEVHPLASE